MTNGILTPADERVRGALTQLIAQLGQAPSDEDLALRAGVAVADLAQHLQRLADSHSLLLHPATVRHRAVLVFIDKSQLIHHGLSSQNELCLM